MKAVGMYDLASGYEDADYKATELRKEISYRQGEDYCEQSTLRSNEYYLAFEIWKELPDADYKDSADKFNGLLDRCYSEAYAYYVDGKYSDAVSLCNVLIKYEYTGSDLLFEQAVAERNAR